MTPAPLLPTTPRPSPMGAAPADAGIVEPVRTLLVTGGIGPDPAALTVALEHGGRLLVVGATSDAADGIELALQLQPDVVLIDQVLGLASGAAVARQVLGDVRHAEIVLRTPWPDADRHDAERTGVFATVDVADPAAVVAAARGGGPLRLGLRAAGVVARTRQRRGGAPAWIPLLASAVRRCFRNRRSRWPLPPLRSRRGPK